MYQCQHCLEEVKDVIEIPIIRASAVKNALREIERVLWWQAAVGGSVVDFDDREGCFVTIPGMRSASVVLQKIMRKNLLRSYEVLQDMGALRIVEQNPIKLELTVLGFILAVHNP